MFQIKICGITSVEDALLAAEAGADAVGLNFYPPSPRCLERETARAIAAALPGRVAKVGVFVNAEPAAVEALCDEVPLDIVQLHGDEAPETVAQLKDWPVVRAFRCRQRALDEVLDYVAACRRLNRLPDAVLVDAYQPGSYGGTGRVVDWPAVGRLRLQLDVPVVLAGGLSAANVRQAIAVAEPAAVDVASGVESSPGRKQAAQVRAFVEAARQGFTQR